MDLMGRQFGNYRIDSPLGTGGTGEVFRAVHLHLGHAAAIKVLHPHLATDPSARARFLQEAKAAASLKHPNIIRIDDFGDQDGKLYLVMELLTGGSLRSLLSERAAGRPGRSLRSLVGLMRQAAEGLAAAHAQGMVHRDIKPENLLLSEKRTGEYTVKITDFGLVRLTETSVATVTGTVLGTPAYMSPEQCQGSGLDARSDLYSLGIVLYEVATGYVPFEAKTLTEAMYKHVYVEPPPPRRTQPDLSVGLEEVILRCLGKKPEERFASAKELSEALDAWLRTEPERPIWHSTIAEPAPRDVPGPRVDVQDQSGKIVHTTYLSHKGLTMGRDAGNDVPLVSDEVSRFHLRIDWDGRTATVTDLGSSHGTFLEQSRLLPQAEQPWDGRQPVRIGPFLVRLERAKVSPDQSEPPRPAPRAHAEVAVDQKEMNITPGQPAVCRVTIANSGPIVDHYSIVVEGVPEQWVRGADKKIQLNPGKQATVPLTIGVPRLPSSRAGDYHVTIRASSQEAPEASGSEEARWTVLPFSAMSLDISPAKASATRQATYKVSLHNRGNRRASYTLTSKDDEEKLTRLFAPDERSLKPSVSVDVEPDAAHVVRLKVSGPRRWIGTAATRSFNVQALSQESPQPQIATAQFTHRAMLPSWAIPVGLVVLIALGWLGNYLLRPEIQNMDPATAVAGQTVTMRLKVARVARAQDITIKPPPSGTVSKENDQYIFQETFNGSGSTNLTIEASNLFGHANHTFLVTVQPQVVPKPIINFFTVTPGSITKGGRVTIRWKVSNADTVQIDPLGQVRAQDQRDDYPQETTRYKITATNQGGTAGDFREVIVNQPEVVQKPEITFFTVSPPSITKGGHVTVRWRVSNANNVQIDPFGQVPGEGQRDDYPQETTRYKITATNKGGTAGDVREVIVNEANPSGDLTRQREQFNLSTEFGARATIRFRVHQLGSIVLAAYWRGSAPDLALILNGPGQVNYYARKDGRSPLRLAYPVNSTDLAKGDEWTASVVNFSRTGPAQGYLQVTFLPGRLIERK